MKRYLNVGIIFGILVVAVVAISWFAFPAWKDPASGGFWTLLGLTAVSILSFVQGAVSIWKDLKEEKKEEQKPPTPTPMQSIDSQKADAIYMAPGGTIYVYPPAVTSSEPTSEALSFWYIPHPYPMPPNFTGRAAELKTLDDWLADDKDRLFILRALGGFGKSALAWQWINTHVNPAEWTRLVWWSFYDGDASFEHFVEETLKYLKLEVPQGQRTQVDELLKAMQGGKILLIMDGFERALRAYSSMNAAYQGDEETKLEDNRLDCVNNNAEIFLKSVCSLPSMKSKVLMTTRLTPRAVKPRGECLQGCHEEELKAMQKDDAVAFFRVQGIRGTHAEIESACEPYGYHPLSLRILAGLIADDREKPGDIAVASKLDITDNVIANKHHVLEVAYNTLSLEQQELLSAIACFRAPTTYDALKSITIASLSYVGEGDGGDILNLNLKSLETRGLLHWDRKTNKYDLHPIVRRYVYDHLTEPSRLIAHSRLGNYFARLPTPKEPARLVDLQPIIELYYHTIQTKNYHTAYILFRDRLAVPLYHYFGSYHIIIELLLLLFPFGEDKPPIINDKKIQAWILNTLANAYSLHGQLNKSAPLYSRVNNLLSGMHNPKNLAIGVCNQAQELISIGKLRTSEVNLEHATKFLPEIEDKRIIAVFYRQLGRLYAYLGHWEKAIENLGKAGAPFGEMTTEAYFIFTELLMRRTNINTSPRSTITYLLKYNTIMNFFSRGLNDRIQCLWVFGAICRVEKNTTLAEQYLNTALTECRSINNIEHESNILLDLARLRHDQKDYEEAKSLAEEALTITERCGYVLQGADVNLFLAQYALEQEKDKAKAKEYAETALKLAHCEDGPPYHYKVAYEEAERLLEKLK